MRLSRSNPFSLLASPNSLGWQNHVVFFVLSLMALGFFDIDRLGGNFASWFLVFLAGFSTTFLAIEILKRFAKKVTSISKRAFYLFSALLVSGSIRGLVVYEVGSLLGLIPVNELFYRLSSASVFVLSSYFFSNALITSFQKYREQLGNLSLELERLNRSRGSYESDLQLVNQQQRNRVRELLSAPMWELQKKLETATNPSDVQDALLTMQAINNEVVRPLSRELSESVAEPKPDLTLPKAGGWFPALPNRVTLSETQPAWLLFGVLFVLGLNAQIALTGFQSGVQIVLLATAPVILLFVVEKKVFGALKLTIPAALVISTAFGVASSSIGGLLVEWSGLAITDLFIGQTISFLLVLKTSNLFYGIFLVGWQQSLGRLSEVNAEQRLVNSRLRQQLWLGQKALAMELHGSVQATLQALAFRLSRMKETNIDELQQVLFSVRQALARIENQEYLAGQPFGLLLEELRDLWEGTAAVSWTIDDSAKNQLELDLGLARCSFEVIRESVTNAVKHGSANEIAIDLSSTDEVLKVSISNNGSMTDNQQGSLGSELMDQLCLTRTLTFEDGLVILRAELALRPVAQQSLV